MQRRHKFYVDIATKKDRCACKKKAQILRGHNTSNEIKKTVVYAIRRKFYIHEKKIRSD